MTYKVLIVTSEFPPGPGGIGNHAYSLSKSLSKLGNDVYVISDADFVKKEDVVAFDKKHKNLSISRIWRSGIKTYLNRITTTRNIIKKNKIDVVIYSGKFSLWISGLLSLSRRSYKTIGVLHGSEVKMRNTFYRYITNLCISRLNYLLPVSKFTHSLLNKSLQKNPYQIIENGIDLQEMAALNEGKRVDKNKFIGDPCLLTVGNVTPRKGQQRVIKALPNLIKQYPNLHYHIVGLPTFEKEFSTISESLGVNDYITFHGRLPKRTDLGVAYNSADCFLILSENQPDGDVEGFGIVVLEANFFGLPVIGAKGCGIADAIKHGSNGYLVDGNSPQDINESLNKVQINSSELSKNAIDWAHNHSWDYIGKKYDTIINTLLKEK